MVSANSAVYAHYSEVGVPLVHVAFTFGLWNGLQKHILEIYAPSVMIIFLQNVKMGWWLCGHLL